MTDDDSTPIPRCTSKTYAEERPDLEGYAELNRTATWAGVRVSHNSTGNGPR